MVHLVVIALGLVVQTQEEPIRAVASDLKTYDAVRAKAGRDPSAHVKLALWCEAHGLNAERVRHLAQAIAIDPKNVAARGLLGLIDYGGQWLRPEAVGDKRKSDPALMKKLEEYHARRASLEASKRAVADPRKASRAHETLAMWCEQQGLLDQAIAHFTMAVQLDPYHDAAWKHLGYVKRRGRWMSREQIAADEQDADAQRKADKYWEPLLRKWKTSLNDKARRDQAEQDIANVVDPRAVPSIMRVFGSGSPAQQLIAVSMLARINSPAAIKELARLAILSDSDSTRQAATAALEGRLLRDYVGELVDMVQSKVVYKVQQVQGPGSTGALAVDTPRFHIVRTYDAPPAFTLANTFRGVVGYDANGMPFVAAGAEMDKISRLPFFGFQQMALLAIEARTQELLATANLKAANAQQQLAADVRAIETFNSESSVLNQRIMTVLESLAGAPDIKDDQDALKVWWYDRLGYQYEPPEKVTIVQEDVAPQFAPPHIYTCFAAGTLVRTPDGSCPIERVHVGDLVLSQDVATGALDYSPVLVVHHNKPSETLRTTLTNGETLVSSVYHRFWRSGSGWALARELKPGDKLRTLGGQVCVASIEHGSVVPVYNLDVARKHSFFVGHDCTLVHDNTLPDARLQPFDELPVLKPVTSGTE
jgi:tetratricopeptide (TPR) repeat protein